MLRDYVGESVGASDTRSVAVELAWSSGRGELRFEATRNTVAGKTYLDDVGWCIMQWAMNRVAMSRLRSYKGSLVVDSTWQRRHSPSPMTYWRHHAATPPEVIGPCPSFW
jgi:hypothetical protein